MPVGIGKRGIGSRAGIGRKQIAARYAQVDQQVPYSFPAGSYTFTVPKAGYWRFVLWGGGGTATNPSTNGGSGAYYEGVRYLRSGQAVAIVTGAQGANSTVTLPGGEVLTAGGTGSSSAGTATANNPSDIALNGTAGGSSAGGNGAGNNGGIGGSPVGGAGAPGNGSFRGGDGANNALSTAADGATPGGGGSTDVSGSPIGSYGGKGLVLVAYVRE